VLIDFERGVGNPTLASLQAMGKPFGLEIAFVRRRDDACAALGQYRGYLQRFGQPARRVVHRTSMGD